MHNNSLFMCWSLSFYYQLFHHLLFSFQLPRVGRLLQRVQHLTNSWFLRLPVKGSEQTSLKSTWDTVRSECLRLSYAVHDMWWWRDNPTLSCSVKRHWADIWCLLHAEFVIVIELYGGVMPLLLLGLLDPRWREQKNKEIEERREQEEVFAAGQFAVDINNVFHLYQLRYSSLSGQHVRLTKTATITTRQSQQHVQPTSQLDVSIKQSKWIALHWVNSTTCQSISVRKPKI